MSDHVERAVLARMLVSRATRQIGLERLGAADFRYMMTRLLFTAMGELHAAGKPVTVESVAAKSGAKVATVAEVRDHDTSGASGESWISELVDLSMRRHARAVAERIVANADHPDVDAQWFRDQFAEGTTLLPSAASRRAVADIDTFVETTDRAYSWLVPWMLERGERLLLVGEEGKGKSILLRQWAFQLAAGCHWASGKIIEPGKVLVIDAENSPKQVARAATWPLEMARKYADGTPAKWDPTRLRVETIHRLDIVSNREQRDTIDRWLERYRPDLLLIGPLYKVGRDVKGANYKDNAMAMTDVLDGWRERFGCAVAMEHHSPKGESGSPRELSPADSSVWMRWPDIGVNVRYQRAREEVPEKGAHSWCPELLTHFHVGDFRGMRGFHQYPNVLVYGDRRLDQWQWHNPTMQAWSDPANDVF